MNFTPDEDQSRLDRTTRKGFIMGTLTCPNCDWWDDMALWQIGEADGCDPDATGPGGHEIETEHNQNPIPGDPCPAGPLDVTAWIASALGWKDIVGDEDETPAPDLSIYNAHPDDDPDEAQGRPE
jgi:Zn ribbon nucleic-acid-binding protein